MNKLDTNKLSKNTSSKTYEVASRLTSKGADAAIAKAKEDLNNILKNRYPANVVIDYDLYQSDRDKCYNRLD